MNGALPSLPAPTALPSTLVMFHSPASADMDLILPLVAHEARNAVMHIANNTFFMSVCRFIKIMNYVSLNNLLYLCLFCDRKDS
jgi:hypothetical protein